MGLDCSRGTADVDCQGAGDAGQGGYTLGDMGKILCDGFTCEPEFHADGEIWAQTLWDVRQKLVASLGGNTLNGAGVTRARSLITRAMELSPPDPSMLEMRNAILQADQAIYANADKGALWSAFALRGMGYFATDTGATDTGPRQDFTKPPNCNQIACGILTGLVREAEGGAPIPNAVVEIKGAGDLVGTTNAQGRYRIPKVPPHTYRQVTAAAPGHQPTAVGNLTVGTTTQTQNFNIHRDWADLATGANLVSASPPDFTSFGCGPSAAFDISLASGWGSTAVNAVDPTNPDGPKQATITLPRTIDITSFAVDPGGDLRRRRQRLDQAAADPDRSDRRRSALHDRGRVHLRRGRQPQAERREPDDRQPERAPDQDHDARQSGRRPGGGELHGPVGVPGLRHAVGAAARRAQAQGEGTSTTRQPSGSSKVSAPTDSQNGFSAATGAPPSGSSCAATSSRRSRSGK